MHANCIIHARLSVRLLALFSMLFIASCGKEEDNVTSSAGNGGTTGGATGPAAHTCGAPNVHNPNLTYGSMTDQEGNVYKTIVIGTQEWMAENLNTSIYRNGDPIPTNLDNATWQSTTSGAWAYYDNDASYACPYGKLYNWYACVDARQLCPVGWHVPTDTEWSALKNYLGGWTVAGGKMKTTGTIGPDSAGTIGAEVGLWYSPNSGAINSSGFSGAPGGVRYDFGAYVGIGFDGIWWSSYEVDTYAASNHYLHKEHVNAGRNISHKQYGLSVRCLMD
jgi:uncharacterized protein (TIGR02145 family)